MHREPPPPPPATPASVLLLLAVGDLLDATGDDAVYDLAPVAAAIGCSVVDVPPLVGRGVEAGYLEYDDDGKGDGLRLTARGRAWYGRHRDRR